MIEDCSSEYSGVNIIERLEKLNKWQEEQKSLLQERQNKQRELLGIEQKTIYQMMGLVNNNDKLDASVVQEVNEDENEKTAVEEPNKEKKYDLNNLPKVLNSQQEIICKEPQNKFKLDISSGENSVLEVPKRSFLKRGEGIKVRFKIDPETLRINNLPPYKYAKNIYHSRKIRTNKSSLKIPKDCVGDNSNLKQKILPPLDAQEKRFQHQLMSSKNVYNSTPDLKSSSLSVVEPNSENHHTEDHQNSAKHDDVSICSLSSNTNLIQPISWSKVLDTKNIQPISLKQIRHNTKNTEKEHDHDDSNLSIFELLEQKCNEGPIDLNFTPIKRFLENKYRSNQNENDDIIVDNRLKNAKINPQIVEVIDEQNLSVDEECNKAYMEEAYWNKVQNSEDGSNAGQKQHVRFSDEVDNSSFPDNPSEASTLVDNDYSVQQDFFQQFKEALFFALHNKAAQHDESNNSNVTQASTTSFTNELQEKTNLVKLRLEELEKEIATFKENNKELITAKEKLEIEKVQFQQDQSELLDQLRDEKIQLEIYLHDERMKIEDEKRKFEEKMRMQRSSTVSKDRKEIARLKQELEDIKMQCKQKDQDHTAAQARIRAQMRVLEKDQKQLYEEIDRLNKENKKLQNENLKLNNDSNKKMLQEINKNIAKLTPKLAPLNTNEEENVSKNKNVKIKPQYVTKSNIKKSGLCKHQRNISNIRVKVTEKTATEFLSESSLDEEFVEPKKDRCVYYNKTDHNQIPPADGPNKDISKANPQIPDESVKDFKREIINSDGSRDIWYPNGNVKKISADGLVTRMLYYNKDIKETDINQGTVKYYYAETNTWHTTYLDGLEILEFPNGQTEHRHKNGVVEIHFPNNSVKIINPLDEQHLEEWRFVDGTNLIKMRNGDKIILLPNGQKEIHTKLNKRREYPDGTVKLVYPDGSQETRYSNGRIRLKDKDGNLVMDSES